MAGSPEVETNKRTQTFCLFLESLSRQKENASKSNNRKADLDNKDFKNGNQITLSSGGCISFGVSYNLFAI